MIGKRYKQEPRSKRGRVRATLRIRKERGKCLRFDTIVPISQENVDEFNFRLLGGKS